MINPTYVILTKNLSNIPLIQNNTKFGLEFQVSLHDYAQTQAHNERQFVTDHEMMRYTG